MKLAGKIVSVNINAKKGGRKFPVKEAIVNEEGIKGDGHSGNWHRQVSLLSYDSMLAFNEKAKNKAASLANGTFVETVPGDFGENITTSGIDLKKLHTGDRLIFSGKAGSRASQRRQGKEDISADGVILEVTQIGKECPAPCNIYRRVGSCIMPGEGIFCKVIRTGTIKCGDSIFIK